ncbi:FAD/NAD-P-binding domain-containing protein [Mycena sanguinolenta]|nr:FAD/NAD-P-binding domain-containing protein [Mycena sanguinolenta]
MSLDPRSAAIAVVGSGAAGLITAYTLLQDGFQVQIFTEDSTAGGVWLTARVYPSLETNNVQGEYSFSAMEMPKAQGEFIMGHDFDKFKHIIRFDTEVINIRRDETTSVWFITVEDKTKSSREVLEFSRVVLCTGGCHAPDIPENLSMDAARKAGFRGPVIHFKYFASQLDTILETTHQSIVTVGGGKSAQEQVAYNLTVSLLISHIFSMAAYLANAGKKVTVVFETMDAFLTSSRPFPNFFRKSRLLSILSPQIVLRSRLEHSAITNFFWSTLVRILNREESPFCNAYSLYWSTNANDKGPPRPDRFHALVNAGKIEIIAPVRVQGFGLDGTSVSLSDGRAVKADLVLLATGYASSWTNILDTSSAFKSSNWDNYLSLANPPSHCPDSYQWACNLYNGIVPAKNIARRDFAVNGTVVRLVTFLRPSAGYTLEVIAHWMSSYFLGDEMNIPRTPEEAYEHTERYAVWIRKRYPDTHFSQVILSRGLQDRLINNHPFFCRVKSYSSFLVIRTQADPPPPPAWPQYTDQLLEEMGLASMRSGGNIFTWPFKVISIKEIATLAEERRGKRARRRN